MIQHAPEGASATGYIQSLIAEAARRAQGANAVSAKEGPDRKGFKRLPSRPAVNVRVAAPDAPPSGGALNVTLNEVDERNKWSRGTTASRLFLTFQVLPRESGGWDVRVASADMENDVSLHAADQFGRLHEFEPYYVEFREIAAQYVSAASQDQVRNNLGFSMNRLPNARRKALAEFCKRHTAEGSPGDEGATLDLPVP